ncbi:conserved protein of unknown function (plasmid) [Cupriavidus taiwanensis]|uniref:DUF6602 domain-containing protein n=1 Tax=Cupriavidus taiwanensis TaxID=164546 RepID=A0A375EDQ1_9BURK|nr:DUF6602 domain-containing protein [Cupriavidus taiwanensis]SOZ71188.1 conserved protein of unknown function [Cupriavidus taiwanensis]SOZ72257.1 conserved protein of unknown function [Cupriavidus taiwanensis]SOZ74560.1 conserved protein of unknown function [Cupriavidus taiwanensis]SPA03484.1 conserved protein of unknown function [Cupriavidus taiwanensis]SPA12731.1 conserved hypothetical protein [Cupriavidus taiwanensis]
MANAVDLKQLFAGLQGKLAGELELARATVRHPGDKGGMVEANWLAMLRQHLPERYRVDKATVIDSRGQCSDSIDVVIYDRQYSHLVMQHEAFRYVPAEAVYAVFEVKQTLDKSHLEYAGAKAASVRGLYRTSATTVDIRGETPAKPPIPILAGLLCTHAAWTPAFGEPFQTTMTALTDAHALELGCVASAGAFHREGDTIDCRGAETALAFFLFALLLRLQRVGTVAPVDFRAYMEHL